MYFIHSSSGLNLVFIVTDVELDYSILPMLQINLGLFFIITHRLVIQLGLSIDRYRGLLG